MTPLLSGIRVLELGAMYVNNNRNKRVIALDLKAPEGRAVVERLLARSDVLLHNMRVDAIERLGLGFEAARALNPNIMPKPGATTLRIRHLPKGARHSEALDILWVTPDGSVSSVDRYAQKPLGEKIAVAPLAVHRGAFFGLPGAIVVLLAALTLPLFPVTGYLLYLGRRKATRARRAKPSA